MLRPIDSQLTLAATTMRDNATVNARADAAAAFRAPEVKQEMQERAQTINKTEGDNSAQMKPGDREGHGESYDGGQGKSKKRKYQEQADYWLPPPTVYVPGDPDGKPRIDLSI